MKRAAEDDDIIVTTCRGMNPTLSATSPTTTSVHDRDPFRAALGVERTYEPDEDRMRRLLAILLHGAPRP